MNENNHNGTYGEIITYALAAAVFLGLTLPTIVESYKPKDVKVQNQVRADFWENLDLRGSSDNGLKLIIEDGCKEAEK